MDLNIKIYSVEEVAEILGINYITTLKEIRSGRLKARKIGLGYKVSEQNLLDYINGKDIETFPDKEK